MSAVDVHRLSPDEWALWRDVRLRALADAPDAFGSRLADWQGQGDHEARWRERFVHVAFNAVALRLGRSIGAVGGLRRDDDCIELVSMWVEPESRGTGVGIALVDAVLAWAEQDARSTVVLAVRRGNHHAVGLYERAGFTPAGPNPDDASEDLMTREV